MLTRNFMIYNTNLKIQNFVVTNEKNKKRPSKSFESLNYEHIEKDVYLLSFKWIDTIKISDKYLKSYSNEIQSVFFDDLGKIAVFCNSESDMRYFREKMKEKFETELNILQSYRIWKESFLSNHCYEKVIAYDIRNQNLSANEENLYKFSGDSLKLNALKNILLENEDSLVNVTLMNTDSSVVYYIDSSSLISLSDNVNQSDIYQILKCICERYN